ncbi:MAG: hypothetical protein H6833_07595 [Planctomycetes bacterium]|nr:hypothetical protein [Planctomycetota bacterium]
MSPRTATQRTLALFLGVIIGTALAEASLRAIGWPSRRHLLIETRDGKAYLVARKKLGERGGVDLLPVPSTRAGAVRIGVFGASTTFGAPYPVPYRIWKWLEEELEARNPGLDVTFHNFGRPAIALRQVVDIVREVPDGYLDLAICIAGNNEFLIEHVRTLETRPAPPAWIVGLEAWRGVRIVDVFCRLHPSQAHYDPLPSEAPRVAYAFDGSAFDTRDRIVERAVATLDELVEAFRARDLPLTFVLPVGHIWSFTPGFSATRRANATQATLHGIAQIEALMRAGQWEDVVTTTDRAIASTPDFALFHASRARALAHLRRRDEARIAMRQASTLDLRPGWLTRPLRHAMSHLLDARGVPTIDAEELFGRTHELDDSDDLFADHCHPSIAGQRIIAHELAELMKRRGVFGERASWEGTYQLSETDELEAQAVQRRSRRDALNLTLLSLLVGHADPETVRDLEARYGAWRREDGPPHWQAVLGHGMTLALLSRDAEASEAIHEAFALGPDAEAFLRGLIQGSARVRALMQRLGITKKAMATPR